MIWITREHPEIDRIACPWPALRFMAHVHIVRFVDPSK